MRRQSRTCRDAVAVLGLDEVGDAAAQGCTAAAMRLQQSCGRPCGKSSNGNVVTSQNSDRKRPGTVATYGIHLARRSKMAD